MNTKSKKVCKLALLSNASIIFFILSILIIINIPGYLRGVQPYKILFFISKSFLWIAPVLAVIFGHLAKHKIKNNPLLLSGKVFAIIGFVLGYIILIFIITIHSQVHVCGNGRSSAYSTISKLQLALTRYKEDLGHFPKGTSKNILNELTGYCNSSTEPDEKYKNNPKWRGPYFPSYPKNFKDSQRNQEMIDPWKKPYNFDFKNYEIIIWSCGPNRINENGKGDDISNKN